MKKTIDVCDGCESPNVDVVDGEKAYCISCALTKYDIAIININRCERCGVNMHSYSRVFITKRGIGVYCSLKCAMDAMKEGIDNED